MLLLSHCLLFPPLVVGVLCRSLFSYALLRFISTFAIIFMRKREQAALLKF